MDERDIKLLVGDSKFEVFFSKIDKALILSWVAETGAKNVTWMRILTLRLRWPPWHCETAFVFTEE